MEINEIPALWTEYWRRASQTRPFDKLRVRTRQRTRRRTRRELDGSRLGEHRFLSLAAGSVEPDNELYRITSFVI